MRKLLFGCSLVAVLFLGACQKDDTRLSIEEGYGLLQLRGEASSEVLTRAQVDFTVPEVADFSLSIQGSDYAQSWEHFSDFVSADNKLMAGDYTASIAWGNPAEEGVNKPAYVGSTPFVIYSQQVTQASITAKLANAQVLVCFTEKFLGYFHDAVITLKTAAGSEFTFTPEVTESVFVAPGNFTLTGSALKQNDAQITFPERTMQAKAQYRYTYTYDMSTAGSATVTIRLDDTLIEEIVIEEELNPES